LGSPNLIYKKEKIKNIPGIEYKNNKYFLGEYLLIFFKIKKSGIMMDNINAINAIGYMFMTINICGVCNKDTLSVVYLKVITKKSSIISIFVL